METWLKDKEIVLGVSGGIAAYKSAELLRLIIRQGARVRVIMTRSACAFVRPLTFEALSGRPVYSDLFDDRGDGAIRHIDWAQSADAVLIAPATANVIGKLAGGIADDALSTFMLAVTAPKLVCPSMNTHMYENRAVQRNIDILENDGYVVVEPDAGELACGTTGAGRLPEPAFIVDRLARALYKKDMAGRKVVVTAGPTREAIDPVRFISNHSSGKMGYAVARMAEYRGADVTLVSGPTHLQPPFGVTVVPVESASEMASAVLDASTSADIIVKVAAVADYRPETCADHKIKKNDAGMVLQLEKTMDILKTLGERKTRQFLVGFAAETRDLDANAASKLAAKNLDMIVGNVVGNADSGFGADTNQVTLYMAGGVKETLPMMTKAALGDVILDRVVEQLSKRGGQ